MEGFTTSRSTFQTEWNIDPVDLVSVSPGKYQRWPSQCLFASISNPLWTTEFRASSAKELPGNS